MIILHRTPDRVAILLPIIFLARGGRHPVAPVKARPPQQDRGLIAVLSKAHAIAQHRTRAAGDGRQPHHLDLETFNRSELPLNCSRQRDLLSFRQ